MMAERRCSGGYAATRASNFAWVSGVKAKVSPSSASFRSDLWNFAGAYSICG